jgi:hypothetical protein
MQQSVMKMFVAVGGDRGRDRSRSRDRGRLGGVVWDYGSGG